MQADRTVVRIITLPGDPTPRLHHSHLRLCLRSGVIVLRYALLLLTKLMFYRQ
jgi:hypothetical protein